MPMCLCQVLCEVRNLSDVARYFWGSMSRVDHSVISSTRGLKTRHRQKIIVVQDVHQLRLIPIMLPSVYVLVQSNRRLTLRKT